MSFGVETLAQPAVRRLRAYDPGHDIVALRARHAEHGLLELGGNESHWGPSADVEVALASEVPHLLRYPDPLGLRLKGALAAHHDHPTAGIILGNGSHELLMQLAQVFAGPDAGVLVSRFGFAVYPIAAAAVGAPLAVAPALPVDAPMPLGHDPEAMLAAISPETRLVYFANPNNPTGTWWSGAQLERFILALPRGVVCVVDEAYAEFVTDPDWRSAIALLPRCPRLVVTRTFSKIHGLAGLRVGFALGAPALIALVERLRESFNVNQLGLAAAEAALGDHAHIERVRQNNAQQRHWLSAALRERGLWVGPSQGNFVLVRFGPDCARVDAGLLERGVVVRPMTGYGLPEYLRITIGLRSDSERLLAALDETLSVVAA
ncbi:MAG: histidinol-phosphate transaminase [Gammaproteobacteria bacterium HGW-Gammaproteobacteria-7]|nr:MAG: histidinol-phosphate transaminase [Gammaproteobacteria bacterium HGW-Gammaproteobacteria-7]